MPPQQQYPAPAMPPAANQPHRHKMNALLIPLIVLALFAIGAGVFAVWAYSSRQDYKNNTDQKIDTAVKVAVQKESTAKDAEFVQKEKEPLKNFSGPETYGNIKITYPKTWSAYVVQADGAAAPLDAYFHPDYVPGVNSGTAYALRIQVLNQTYDAVLKQIEAKAKAGKITVSAYAAPKVPGVVGARAVGEVNIGQKDDLVILPLRDKTIEISTQSAQFSNDFNKFILPNLTFSP